MPIQPIRLGVNLDHIATLRQARGTSYPDPVQASTLAVLGGADQITVHLREDRRHIQDRDVYLLKQILDIPLNLEMANTAEMVGIALEVQPRIVTLVPEKREELTTEGGLDIVGQQESIQATTQRLQQAGIKVSLFVEADLAQLKASSEIGADTVELHTGTYCDADAASQPHELQRLIKAAQDAHALGLEVVAGHGLHLKNVGPVAAIPEIVELNIGHALIAHASFVGLQQAVAEMAACMRSHRK